MNRFSKCFGRNIVKPFSFVTPGHIVGIWPTALCSHSEMQRGSILYPTDRTVQSQPSGRLDGSLTILSAVTSEKSCHFFCNPLRLRVHMVSMVVTSHTGRVCGWVVCETTLYVRSFSEHLHCIFQNIIGPIMSFSVFWFLDFVSLNGLRSSAPSCCEHKTHYWLN